MVCIFLLTVPAPLPSWDGTGQRMIANRAIETLPFPLRAFFRNHRQEILLLAVGPNQWGETPTAGSGFIRLEEYGTFPFSNLPRDYNQAVRKFTREKVALNGTLPWTIGTYSLKLEEAFRNQEWDKVKLYAAMLGHYVAEAHDPFNTTTNFDGRLTNQWGVDTRYADSLVNRYQMFFIVRPTGAFHIDNPTNHAFGMVLESHTWVDNVLLADAQARSGKVDYNDEYYSDFYGAAGAILVRQITNASLMVGSYWYTAWQNAGSPPLPAR